jgi:hypothetical protein
MNVVLGKLALVVLTVVACGGAPSPTMSDAQLLWCDKHNMTPLVSIGAFSGKEGSEVLQDARKLGLTIPPDIDKADGIFATMNLTNDSNLANTLPDWNAAMKVWVQTPDYARACVAAFESR